MVGIAESFHGLSVVHSFFFRLLLGFAREVSRGIFGDEVVILRCIENAAQADDDLINVRLRQDRYRIKEELQIKWSNGL